LGNLRQNSCKSLQIVAFSCKSLQIVANRCKSLQIVAKILQCPINNLLIPYYIFRRNTVTTKTLLQQVKPAHSNSQKVAKSKS
jgi:hypothetical protein